MKKIIGVVVVVLLLGTYAGWYFWWIPKQKDNFINTYKEILILREQYQDTAKANPLVKKAIQLHGFTALEFKQTYFDYAQDSKAFMAMLDSARERAKREVMALDKKVMKNEAPKDKQPEVKKK